MSVKLSESELAALDLLIKHMEEEGIDDALSPEAWVVAAAKVAARVAAKAAVAEAATQAVKAVVGGDAVDPRTLKSIQADSIGDKVTLHELKAIQQQLLK